MLKERRIELAFEGHRVYDVYRNKQALNLLTGAITSRD
ncbi:RagB/SusD family nutrient uptake outer membrane protein [Chitinophaga pinensis]|nr:RagB/SusD family nutrient uptake outer membrane protein [Chitinophaga pinensis]